MEGLALTTVARVVSAHEQRDISLNHFRGRSCDEEVVQAADFLVRQQTGLIGVDDLTPEALPDIPREGRAEVRFRHSDGHYIARLHVGLQEARATSCRSGKLERPRQYRLESLSTT